MMGFYTFAYSLLILPTAAVYIDPATTSYIIQIVVGILVAVGTTVGIFWNKIRRRVKKNGNTDKPAVKRERKGGGTLSADELLKDDSED